MVGTLRYRTTVTLVTMSLETGFVSFYACSWLFQLVQLLNSWESKLELKRGNHVGIFIVLPFTFLKNLKLRHFKSQLSKDNKEIYRKAWKELFRTLGVRSFEIIQIRIQDHLDHGITIEHSLWAILVSYGYVCLWWPFLPHHPVLIRFSVFGKINPEIRAWAVIWILSPSHPMLPVTTRRQFPASHGQQNA